MRRARPCAGFTVTPLKRRRIRTDGFFVEERELTVFLVVDVSASESFGTVAQLKSEMAAEVCALLAFSAIKNNDRVALIAFSDQIEKFVPPGKGSSHVLRVIREVLYLRPEHRQTDIACAINYLSHVAKRRSVVFIISDFQAEGYEAPLRVAARRHQVIGVSLTDPRELSLPPVGLILLEDLETGQRLWLDTLDPATREQFARCGAQRQESRRRLLSSVGVDEVRLYTHRSYVEPLIAYFRSRQAVTQPHFGRV